MKTKPQGRSADPLRLQLERIWDLKQVLNTGPYEATFKFTLGRLTYVITNGVQWRYEIRFKDKLLWWWDFHKISAWDDNFWVGRWEVRGPFQQEVMPVLQTYFQELLIKVVNFEAERDERKRREDLALVNHYIELEK